MKIKTIITLAVALVATAFAIAQPTAPAAAPPVDSTTPVLVGQTVVLAVTADGTAPFTYQWKKNATSISAATAATYTISPVSTTSAGDYTVTVTNSAGSTTSPKATLVVNLATVITAQPKALSALTGTAAKFTVAATGTGLSYQWQKDGVNVPDTNASAKTASLTIPVVAPADAAVYSVIVTGAGGTVTSSPAPLVVIQVTLPTITSFTTTVR